jgi:regulator of PEP synthase PpsR (kinase-PPPase family)
MIPRIVFFVSDQTGVTAETLGHSLLTQFDGQEFTHVTVPFVDSVDKAEAVVLKIDAAARKGEMRPIVFSSLVKDDIRAVLGRCDGLVIDFFDAFLAPLESELGMQSSHTLGRGHGMADTRSYNQRIEATNFALANDDGTTTRHYQEADVILVGVSRSGKTPTCLYLAMQYGVYAANYPLAEDELESVQLPRSLLAYRNKLFGLTIAADRLRQIRKERRPTGQYSSAAQVRFEVSAAEKIFKKHAIPFVDTTEFSIEEIASTILNEAGVERRVR